MWEEIIYGYLNMLSDIELRVSRQYCFGGYRTLFGLNWNARLCKWTRTECVSCTIICLKFNFSEIEHRNAVDVAVVTVVYQYLNHFVVGVRVILWRIQTIICTIFGAQFQSLWTTCAFENLIDMIVYELYILTITPTCV